MNLVHYQNNLPAGLGWKIFGKTVTLGGVAKGLVKLVGGVVSEAARSLIPLVGNSIGDAIDSYVGKFALGLSELIDGGGVSFRVGIIDITAADQAKLQAFFNGPFKIFLQNCVAQIGQASSLSDPQAKLTALNAVINKISAVQDHYAVTKEPTISPLANDQRELIINVGLQSVFDAVQGVLGTIDGVVKESQVSFSASAMNYQPLFTNTIVTTVQATNYVFAGKGPVITQGTTPTPSTDPKGNTSGGGLVPTKAQTLDTPIRTIGQTGNTIPVATIPATATPVNKSFTANPVVRIGAGIAIAALLIKAFSGSKKKKK